MKFKRIIDCVFALVLGFSVIGFPGDISAQTESSVEKTIEKLRSIHVILTEDQGKEELVLSWLGNPESGYPDLVQVLFESVQCPQGGCKIKGPLLPLDAIEGKCRAIRGKPGDVILEHKKEEVIKAFILTWWERNTHRKKLELEQILRGE